MSCGQGYNLTYTIWRLSVPTFNNGLSKEIEGEPENGNFKT